MADVFVQPGELPRPDLTPEQFETVQQIVASYSGIYLDSSNQRGLVLALGQRMQATRLTLPGYIDRIGKLGNLDEVQQLAELLVNHETIFFRNTAHMKALRHTIVPHLHRRKPAGEPLRIWSAGCSTGEEPYSLAMIALETLGDPLPRPVDIRGTDLSAPALARARIGCYKGRAMTNVAPHLKQRYFVRQEPGWLLAPTVRDLVTFEQVNLLEPFPDWTQGVDIIFCQNVTIYFELATFRRLVEQFYHRLPEGGLLFLGFSETLWNVFDRFRLHEIGSAFVYVKETDQPTRATRPSTRPLPPLPERPDPAADQPAAPRSRRGTGERRTPAPPDGQPLRRTATGTLADNAAGANKYQTRPLSPPRPMPPPPAAARAAPAEQDAVQQGRALLDGGRVDEVLALLDQVPLRGPHAPQLLALAARAHANRGDIDLAMAEARRALELDTMTVEAYLLLGVLCLQQNQVPASVRHLERARYLQPEAPLVSFHLAEAYRQQQRAEAALREYRNTLQKLAEHPPDTVLDGVAIGWLQETCRRYIQQLS